VPIRRYTVEFTQLDMHLSIPLGIQT